MREINFYKTEAGDSPIGEFLDSLPNKAREKVVWTLDLIEQLDVIPKNYLKKMVNTNDIWEVRISSNTNIYRILCFWDGGKLLVLNHAFQKKTQKTPKQAIKLAEKRKADYIRRKAK